MCHMGIYLKLYLHDFAINKFNNIVLFLAVAFQQTIPRKNNLK